MQPRIHCLMSKPMPLAMRMNCGAQEGLTFNLCFATFANVLVIMSSYFWGEISVSLVPRAGWHKEEQVEVFNAYFFS